MRISGTTSRRNSLIIAAVIIVIILAVYGQPCSAEVSEKPEYSPGEQVRMGERMYREGILPSGMAMKSVIKGNLSAPGTTFTCAGCHLRAGLGSVEGTVVTPPTTGNKLYQPFSRQQLLVDTAGRAGNSKLTTKVTQRPAYDRKSLAHALRHGIDPAGHALHETMPRYLLSDRDMAILISYLETLSSKPSPGVSSKGFRFATIISDDVSREDRQALLQPLQSFVEQKNNQLKLYRDFIKFGYAPTVDMKYAFHQVSLDIWELKGPPDTWPSQLDEYYTNQPVFAVLGGISNGDWRPIHEFCESRRLPCLFPITDLPVISETGWYTYYFSKGYFQEGDAAARYLSRLPTISAATPILQIVQDSTAGKALAAGFQESWNELEHPPTITLTLTASQLQDQAEMGKLLAKHKPGVLMLWTDAGLLSNLPTLLAQLAPPGVLFASSSYFGTKALTIPDSIRDKVYLTFPYRLTPFVGSKDGGFEAKVPILASAKDIGDRRIASRSNTMLNQVVLRGLNLLYDNLYRDHLLDILGMQMDVTVRDYETLGFGVGQRYLSRGCYIIQLGPGSDPALLPRSDWIIQ